MTGAAWIVVAASSLVLVSCAVRPAEPVEPECRLRGDELEARLHEIRALVAEHCVHVREHAGGLALRFEGGPPVHDRVRDLARRERACCPFLEWDVGEPAGEHFEVHLTGPPEARGVLRDVLGGRADR